MRFCLGLAAIASALAPLPPAAALVACDVGDAVDAIWAGDGLYKGATIVEVDLTASPDPIFTVDWDDLSLSFRTVTPLQAQKGAVTCTTVVDTGLSFSAVTGVATTLHLTGMALSNNNRLLIVASGGSCGSATMDPASSGDPPGTPVGETDMFFFDVVITAAATYKVCFWSGQAVGGYGESDVQSYTTTVGDLVVSDALVITTTTTTTAVTFSRRRGSTYASTQLTVEGSRGVVYSDLSANPAAWNVHFPSDQAGSCRTCSRYSRSDIDGNWQQSTPLLLVGRMVPAPSGTPSVLGTACDAPALQVAPPAPLSLLLALRGGCSFRSKASNAATRGYRGLLVVDFQGAETLLPDMSAVANGGDETDVSLPCWMLPSDEGETLRALSDVDPVITVSIEDTARKPRLSSSLTDAFGLRTYIEM